MGQSATYLALEAMIEQGWLIMAFSELVKLLDFLEEHGLITSEEHQALLELSGKKLRLPPSRRN